MHRSEMRNCTLLEVLECGQRQAAQFAREPCEDNCLTFEYNVGFAWSPLTLEMLELRVEEMEALLPDYFLLMDKLAEFGPYSRSPVKGSEWNHTFL